MKRILMFSVVVLVSIMLAACGSKSSSTGENYPSKAIELVAAGSPGGGLDSLARAVDQGFNDAGLRDQPFNITNNGGGGGNPARAYMKEKNGNPYHLLSESNRVYINNLVGTTELGIDDVTPIARVATEYLVWVVKADSEFTDAIQVLDKLKEDPHSVLFGVGTVPSNDQMNVLRPASEYGIDVSQIEIVAHNSGGDLITQLVGGHIPIVSTGISEAIEFVKSGDARILAVSAPEPLQGELVDIPTWKSLGIDVSILHWRGIFGPPNMPENTVEYWDNKFGELVNQKNGKRF
ncbi:tripartite tricarboxylate transporter substrate binding protein [Anaerobacillus sp. CMMVII]|uniref:tripartite tricarboxylate transporter substrate-binding protein n=1 Tax=Anaerobacillus sp. CMMVII TaxID=2755588 RepID=UPI0021B730FA|nr:tripartite tricarboxylate transporter substrate-binding protein [Anaerobacillus sp. CMMVII]MCT8140508.1 tripartite tricarboxylate transporter substrate binding protein [Anaerobacillus sp. CMMVII]